MNQTNELGAPVHVQARETEPHDVDAALQPLFHRLNNQLSIILAHAELIESKAGTDLERARASQVVTSVLDAMGTARQIRSVTNG